MASLPSSISSIDQNPRTQDWTAAIEWVIVLVGLFGILLGGYQLTTLTDTDQDVKLLAVAATTAVLIGVYLLTTVLKSRLRRA